MREGGRACARAKERERERHRERERDLHFHNLPHQLCILHLVLGFEFQVPGFGGLGFGSQFLGSVVSSFGFRVRGLGFELRLPGLKLRVLGTGFTPQASKKARAALKQATHRR